MTRPAKTPEEVATFNETKKTAEFLKRIRQLKLDPYLSGYSDQVSGLFENGEWVFICSQHVQARFSNEEEVKQHFRKEVHTQSSFEKTKSMYD